MTLPHSPQPGPRPGPPPGGYRPAPPPAGYPPPAQAPVSAPPDDEWDDDVWPDDEQSATPRPVAPASAPGPAEAGTAGGTGHPAVDAVLQALANAARLAPADQIAEYEAAHRVLQETLTTIDR